MLYSSASILVRFLYLPVVRLSRVSGDVPFDSSSIKIFSPLGFAVILSEPVFGVRRWLLESSFYKGTEMKSVFVSYQARFSSTVC